MVERYANTNREQWLQRRKTAVTASDIGALFNCHPYQSRLGLFLDKTAHPAGERQVNEATVRRGRILEEGVAEAVRELRPSWRIDRANDYLFRPLQKILIRGEPMNVGIGATPDYIVRCPERGRGILQTKTAIRPVFDQHWTPEVPPTWIILQAQQEMMLEEVSWGAIAVLVLDPYTLPAYVYEMDARPDVQAEITAAADRFWADVQCNVRPAADPSLDETLLKRLYPDENGVVVDLAHDNELPELIERYRAAKERAKEAGALEKEVKLIETEIRAKVGDNLGARTREWEVLLPVIQRKAYEVRASSYRPVRIKAL